MFKCIDCENAALEKLLNHIKVDHEIRYVYAINQLRSMVIIETKTETIAEQNKKMSSKK
jgi:hypothetical protein